MTQRISPSQLEMLAACPCFNHKEDFSSSAAEEGTLLHKAFELENPELAFTDEQKELVRAMIMYKTSLIPNHSNYLEFHELYLVSNSITIRSNTFLHGTADYLLFDRDNNRVKILDAKFGRLEVTEADDNLQGKAYALMAFEKFLPDEVEVHFYVPRANQISGCTFTKQDKEGIVTEIENIIKKTNAPKKKPVTNPYCGRCGAMAVCKNFIASALEIARDISDDETLPVILRNPELWTQEDKAQVLHIRSLISTWCDEVGKYLSPLKDSTPIPGYEIRSRSNGFEVNNIKRVLDTAVVLGATEETTLPALSLSLTKLCKANEHIEDFKKNLFNLAGESLTPKPEISYWQKIKEKKSKCIQ